MSKSQFGMQDEVRIMKERWDQLHPSSIGSTFLFANQVVLDRYVRKGGRLSFVDSTPPVSNSLVNKLGMLQKLRGHLNFPTTADLDAIDSKFKVRDTADVVLVNNRSVDSLSTAEEVSGNLLKYICQIPDGVGGSSGSPGAWDDIDLLSSTATVWFQTLGQNGVWGSKSGGDIWTINYSVIAT